LQTYGTFGPILSTLRAVLKLPGSVTWSHWEKGATGLRPVFRYQFAGNPTVNLIGCCFPEGRGNARIGISAGSHGEIVIDPVSGTILRAQLEFDLPGFVPTRRSDIMVSYGPVEIGGKTYILPLHSVNIWRGRTVASLQQWNVSFATWGPSETEMNVFTFDQYHMFRGNMRMLPGFNQVPDNIPSTGSTAPQ
jgi:hypothetical protein